MEDIRRAVQSSLAAVLRAGGSAVELADSARLHEDLGLTSLHMVTAITSLSGELRINLLQDPSLDLSKLATVGDLVGAFARARAAGW
jgi:acyl carrier protein